MALPFGRDAILDYLDDTMRHVAARPRMYASTPEGVQSVFSTLDAVRSFILREGKPGMDRYSTFLERKGFGCGSFFIQEAKSREEATADEEWIARLCAFWREYLESEAYRDGD